jgi:hypothetical protein
MKGFKFAAAVFGSLTLSVFASVAQAATLDVLKGDVLLSDGTGFKPVSGSSSVKPGDQILPSADGVAKVAYDQGCEVPVKPGSVYVVAAKSPCTLHSAGPGASGATSTPDQASQADYTPYVIGAVIIGGIVAVAASSDDGNKKSSGGSNGGGGNGGGGGGGGAPASP